MSNNEIIIHTDGALRGNPKVGGWAFFIDAPFMLLGKAGFHTEATNNTEEIYSVVAALENLPQTKFKVTVISDSQWLQRFLFTLQ